VSRFFNNKSLLVLLAGIIVLAVLAGVTLNRQTKIVWPERVLIDAFSSVEGVVYKPAQSVANFFRELSNLRSLYDENVKLKATLNDYAKVKVELSDATNENHTLQKMLNYRDQNKAFTMISAAVTGRDFSRWNSMITIDKGSKDGVGANMPVITADGGLVGRVYATADYNCKVLLVTDTYLKDGVSAVVVNSKRPFGIVVGDAVHPGSLQMTYLSPNDIIKTGETVVTSGLSDVFPEGIILGTITDVQRNNPELRLTATIKPAADLDHLESVFVVSHVNTSSGTKP